MYLSQARLLAGRGDAFTRCFLILCKFHQASGRNSPLCIGLRQSDAMTKQWNFKVPPDVEDVDLQLFELVDSCLKRRTPSQVSFTIDLESGWHAYNRSYWSRSAATTEEMCMAAAANGH